ncbi:SSI family serine proteinase inhibitor [Streptomyces sp. WMMC1477]|uniref:SSI family serine proteinase inhibitor n=1 Tax=Streptomyces sp. WMMC1477 TaxID=3015155 RepID=UPI0022B64C80|nr:SSI family serine proteinase inhibitor [Streptomyces sp. WMMC1477]MCZ7432618.1 SSI family serine proteinase inhibitor [Streptomyces sp. WMMC1477]
MGLAAVLAGTGGAAVACPPPWPGLVEDRLTITYHEGKTAAVERFVLECHPSGGDHPRAAEACATLDQATRNRAASPFTPVERDAICTFIYGGPQTARITGTWDGREIDAEFDRTNGCEIARWDRLTPALPEVR